MCHSRAPSSKLASRSRQRPRSRSTTNRTAGSSSDSPRLPSWHVSITNSRPSLGAAEPACEQGVLARDGQSLDYVIIRCNQIFNLRSPGKLRRLMKAAPTPGILPSYHQCFKLACLCGMPAVALFYYYCGHGGTWVSLLITLGLQLNLAIPPYLFLPDKTGWKPTCLIYRSAYIILCIPAHRGPRDTACI